MNIDSLQLFQEFLAKHWGLCFIVLLVCRNKPTGIEELHSSTLHFIVINSSLRWDMIVAGRLMSACLPCHVSNDTDGCWGRALSGIKRWRLGHGSSAGHRLLFTSSEVSFHCSGWSYRALGASNAWFHRWCNLAIAIVLDNDDGSVLRMILTFLWYT